MIIERETKEQEPKFIYAGNINNQIRDQVYHWDFKKAVRGHYPINGDRYTIEEFSDVVSPTILCRTNPNYLGCQTVKDDNDETWWLFYVPASELTKFTRIDPQTNSNAIVSLILRNKGWCCIYANLVSDPISKGDYMSVKVWMYKNTQKLIVTRTCVSNDTHVDRCIREASVEAIMPSKYGPGFSTVYTKSIFFEDNDPVRNISYGPTWKETIGIGLDEDPVSVGKCVYAYISGKYINVDL